jgi:hypothetical protein
LLNDNAIVLLAGADPDLLVLRSAMLATVGIWSLRVRSVEHAIQVIDLVPFEMTILCYTWDAEDRQRLIAIPGDKSGIATLQLSPGDDCSATYFFRGPVRPLRLIPTKSIPFWNPLGPRRE